MGININSNLSLGSKLPLDSRQVVETLDDLLALDTNILYNGIQVYVNELDVRYQYHEDYNETDTGHWKLISVGEATESDIIVAHTPDEADALQKKVNRNKLMFYMGNTKSSYVHGELYYLHWNAITIKKFYTKGGGILEIDYDVLEQRYANWSDTITFNAKYKEDPSNAMNRWFCEYSGGSGSRLDVVGVNIANGSETLGDVIEFTYNSASKNSDNYTWKPLFVKPQRTFEKNWWLVNKIATYGGGYDNEFINGHRYQFTADININATASENIVVSLDEEQYKNYFRLHSKSSFIYNANTGCFEYRYGAIGYEDNRFTIEYLNKAGITWTGEIANDDAIIITCSMSNNINDYYWKDLDAEGGDYTQLTQSEYDALTEDEKMDGREYRTYDTGHIYKLGVEYGKDACFTSLSQLGLTADATVEDVVNALKSGESFLAPVNTFTNYETIFPNKLPNDQWNKVHIIKGTSLGNSHIRCFSQSGACEYLANVNNTNIVSWNDVSGTYIDISDSVIEKLGNEILKYPVGKYRINSTTTGNKFIDLPSDAETKCGLIEVNGTAVGKSPFTDTWVYRMYKFECLTGTSSYVRRLNSGATVGQIELDTGWQKDGHKIYTSLSQLKLNAPVSVGEIFNAMPDKTMAVIACEGKEGNTDGAVVHVSDVPVSYGVLTIKKNEKGRFSIEYQNSLQGSPCNVKRWIGTLKGNDGTGLYWKQLSAEPTFVTLNDIGLTADATFQDAVDALPKGGSALLGVKEFTNYQTMFPYEEGNDQFARVHIVKGLEDGSCVYARWFRKDGVKEAIAKFHINTNKFDGWQKIIVENSLTDPYSCAGYKRLTGTEDLFTLGTGHYVTEKANTAYNYPITDTSNLTAHIYVLGCLNDPTNNKGYRIILYFDNKGRMYRINEWWGVFTDNGWQEIITKDYVDNAVSNSGNTFNGKEVKSITIDLSASAFQVKGTSLYKIALDNYISADTNVIKVEGYYVPPTDANSTYKDKRYIVHTSDSDRAGGIRYYDGSWTTCVCQSESGSKKGSGYAKIYYIN